VRPEFDVIVVGAGPAGAAASLTLARSGANVLMLEKGKIPGERNMTGGVLYGRFEGGWGMTDLIPDFEATAPLQRKMVSHEVVVLSEPDTAKGTAKYYRLSRRSVPARLGLLNLEFGTGHDYSVLRRPFDRWFAKRAVESGAMLSTETTVEGLLTENGAVRGVVTGKEELRAKLVIDCSGVTSRLVREAGLRDDLSPHQLYHGIKRVYSLDEGTIEKRFRVGPGEGCAVFFLGGFMHGISGGAFIYTNRDTLSVGIVASLDSLIRESTEHFDRVGKLLDVQDDFEAHPMVAELLDGAKAVEYSAHNIPKGFRSIPRKPYADGYLAAGDALGAFVKIGPMIDGMRRAIASGMMAARAYLEASSSGSFRGRDLSRYRELLTPIYEDVNRSGRDSLVSESSLVYRTLPRIVFGSRLMARTYAFKPTAAQAKGDAIQRVQTGTSLLNYDEDEDYSHIKVDVSVASKSASKPWVPACPVNCYTVLTPKGVFASYKDLYEHNLAMQGGSSGEGPGGRRSAFSRTLEEVASAQLRFDHVACVACGTCGAVGPAEAVTFTHERDGHGVRYQYG
jgi:electron transfer flavoprotein-quinone oxidoreductase